MQEDKLRTLLELAGKITERRPHEPLIIIRTQQGQWIASQRGTMHDVVQIQVPQAGHAGLETALTEFITNR